MKTKTCKQCGHDFEPSRPMQAVCGPLCASRYVRKERAEKVKKAKAEKQIDRERKAKLKTRGQWLKEAQVAFNAYIRARDREAGHPCVSSGRELDWSGNGVDAGHFRSTGSAPHLRFHEDNCHAQSKHDNQHLSGNAVEYRIRLIGRIGIEAVEAIESDQEPRHYSVEDLKEIKAKYSAMAKEIAKRNQW